MRITAILVLNIILFIECQSTPKVNKLSIKYGKRDRYLRINIVRKRVLLVKCCGPHRRCSDWKKNLTLIGSSVERSTRVAFDPGQIDISTLKNGAPTILGPAPGQNSLTTVAPSVIKTDAAAVSVVDIIAETSNPPLNTNVQPSVDTTPLEVTTSGDMNAAPESSVAPAADSTVLAANPVTTAQILSAESTLASGSTVNSSPINNTQSSPTLLPGSTSSSGSTSTTTTTTSTTSTTTSTTTTTKAPTIPTSMPSPVYLGLNTCNKSAEKYNASSTLLEPWRYGVFLDICKTTYLLGNHPMNWRENDQMCCSLGMKTVAFETLIEQQCFSDFVQKNTSYNNVTWRFNFNYWTGGLQMGENNYSWHIPGSDNFVGLQKNLVWQTPTASASSTGPICVNFRVFPNDTQNNRIQLTSRSCSQRYVFACEGTTPAPKKCSVNCPRDCKKDNNLFTNNYTVVIDPWKYGYWIDDCGRRFLFSSSDENWGDAWNKCCMLGMNLISFESFSKQECVSKSAKFNKIFFNNNQTWTQGTDNGCRGNYNWCNMTKDFKLDKIYWEQGQPRVGNGDCVYANIFQNATLGIAGCGDRKRYICEGRLGGTQSDARKNECKALWNIQEADIDALYTANPSVRPTNLKCFIKCLGESMNYFDDNQLHHIPVLNMVELMYQENEASLQTGYQNYIDCNGIKRSDECMTASDIFDCGVQNDLAVTSALVNKEKANTTMQYTPPIGCLMSVRTCPSVPPCVLDISLVNSLTATKKNNVGRLINNGINDFFLSNVYDTANISLDYASTYCCGLGMRLAEFKNVFDINRMNDYGSSIPKWGHIGQVRATSLNSDVWCDGGTQIQSDVYEFDSYFPNKCSQTCTYIIIGSPSSSGPAELVFRPCGLAYHFICSKI